MSVHDSPGDRTPFDDPAEQVRPVPAQVPPVLWAVLGLAFLLAASHATEKWSESLAPTELFLGPGEGRGDPVKLVLCFFGGSLALWPFVLGWALIVRLLRGPDAAFVRDLSVQCQAEVEEGAATVHRGVLSRLRYFGHQLEGDSGCGSGETCRIRFRRYAIVAAALRPLPWRRLSGTITVRSGEHHRSTIEAEMTLHGFLETETGERLALEGLLRFLIGADATYTPERFVPVHVVLSVCMTLLVGAYLGLIRLGGPHDPLVLAAFGTALFAAPLAVLGMLSILFQPRWATGLPLVFASLMTLVALVAPPFMALRHLAAASG